MVEQQIEKREDRKSEVERLRTPKRIAEEIKGKVALFFGPSMAGKTTLALYVSLHYEKPLYLRVDKNLTVEEITNFNKNIDVRDVYSYEGLLSELSDPSKLRTYDLIIVDSITGLNEELEARYKPPKLYLELSRMQRQVIFRLNAVKPVITSIVITHSRLSDFEKKIIEPSLNNRVLKFVDVVYYIYKEGDKRKVKLWAKRAIDKGFEFEYEQ